MFFFFQNWYQLISVLPHLWNPNEFDLSTSSGFSFVCFTTTVFPLWIHNIIFNWAFIICSYCIFPTSLSYKYNPMTLTPCQLLYLSQTLTSATPHLISSFIFTSTSILLTTASHFSCLTHTERESLNFLMKEKPFIADRNNSPLKHFPSPILLNFYINISSTSSINYINSLHSNYSI